MRQRCQNPNNKDYKYYGNRGVVVCDEWNEYVNFKNWALSNGYKESLTLDRIDTYGNYCPENCRWISIQEQQRNRRDARLLTFNGETHSMTEWAEITGLKRETIKDRIDRSHWSIDEALTTPLIPNNAERQLRKGAKKEHLKVGDA